MAQVTVGVEEPMCIRCHLQRLLWKNLPAAEAKPLFFRAVQKQYLRSGPPPIYH